MKWVCISFLRTILASLNWRSLLGGVEIDGQEGGWNKCFIYARCYLTVELKVNFQKLCVNYFELCYAVMSHEKPCGT